MTNDTKSQEKIEQEYEKEEELKEENNVKKT